MKHLLMLITQKQLLYCKAFVIVKVGGGVSAPVPVLRGIRQGCTLSGKLYYLTIESLLCRVRRDLTGILISGVDTRIRVSLAAYANDINIFITEQNYVKALTKYQQR